MRSAGNVGRPAGPGPRDAVRVVDGDGDVGVVGRPRRTRGRRDRRACAVASSVAGVEASRAPRRIAGDAVRPRSTSAPSSRRTRARTSALDARGRGWRRSAEPPAARARRRPAPRATAAAAPAGEQPPPAHVPLAQRNDRARHLVKQDTAKGKLIDLSDAAPAPGSEGRPQARRAHRRRQLAARRRAVHRRSHAQAAARRAGRRRHLSGRAAARAPTSTSCWPATSARHRRRRSSRRCAPTRPRSSAFVGRVPRSSCSADRR